VILIKCLEGRLKINKLIKINLIDLTRGKIVASKRHLSRVKGNSLE